LKVQGTALIASAGLLYGMIAVGGSLFSKQGLSALDISFFFLSFSLIPLVPFVASRHFLERMLRSWKYLLAYSLANSGLVLLQFESLSLGLSPAVSALLLYTQPVWTVLLGRLIFSEKVDRAKIMVVILALLGALLITDPTSGAGVTSMRDLYGYAAALLGAVFLSFWIILGKIGRLDAFQKPAELVFAVRGSTLLVVSAVSLATLASGLHLFFSNTTLISKDSVLLIGFAIAAGTVPDFLFYSGIVRVEALRAGVILMLEPISAAVLSALLFISVPSLIQVVGGALILLSNYFVNRRASGQ
jgi:drug/metabolite transporter (DMT)-like permease